MKWNFPLFWRCWNAGMAVRRNWLARHRHPVNFWLHIPGIPLGFASVPLLFLAGWPWAAGAFVVGYGLQWAGHLIEGNDIGELVPLKRLLGMPCVPIAPQYLAEGAPEMVVARVPVAGGEPVGVGGSTGSEAMEA